MKNRTCYYFDDIIKLEDFDIDNILIDEKLQENILIYDIFFAYWFDKIDGFIEIYNGTRYLILFGSEKYDAIYNRIRYLINLINHIYFLSLFCKNQSWFFWFFVFRKNIVFE